MPAVRPRGLAIAGAVVALSAAPSALATGPLTAATLSRTALASGSLAPQLEPLPAVTFAPGLIVPVSGRGIAAGQRVDVGGQWSAIAATPAGGLGFALPPVAAGTRSVTLGAGDPPAPIPGARPQPLVVRPAVIGATVVAGRVRVAFAPVAVAEADAVLTFTLPAGTRALPPGPYLAFLSVDGVASAGPAPPFQLPA